MKIKINNEDKYNLKSSKLLTSLLLIGSIFFLFLGLIQLYCVILQPKGGEGIIKVLGNKYAQQLFIGVLLLTVYIMLRNSKPVKNN